MSPEFRRTLKPDRCHSGVRVSFVNETTAEINKILVVFTRDLVSFMKNRFPFFVWPLPISFGKISSKISSFDRREIVRGAACERCKRGGRSTRASRRS